MSASVWVTPAAPAHFPAAVSPICCVKKKKARLQRWNLTKEVTSRLGRKDPEWLATPWDRMIGMLGITS